MAIEQCIQWWVNIMVCVKKKENQVQKECKEFQLQLRKVDIEDSI